MRFSAFGSGMMFHACIIILTIILLSPYQKRGLAAAVKGGGGTSQYVTIPAPSNQSGLGPMLSYHEETRSYNRYNITAHYAWIKNPVPHWQVHCPDCSAENGGKCSGHLGTDVQAKKHNCLYATNGGPFSFTAKYPCIGGVVSNGRVVNNPSIGDANQCFGLTALSSTTKTKGHDEKRFKGKMEKGKNQDIYSSSSSSSYSWKIGNFSPNDVENLQFLQFLCGFDWLVYNGSVSPNAKNPLIAPRTAMGINSKGELLLFEADGSEIFKIGLTLQQEAEWMRDLGVSFALNLDGGGSSATYYESRGGIQGCPTCIDVPLCCVREVTTMNCITP